LSYFASAPRIALRRHADQALRRQSVHYLQWRNVIAIFITSTPVLLTSKAFMAETAVDVIVS
jgi:hypothetical protein